MQLFFQLPVAKLQPDEVSYGAAFDACSRGSLWREALQIMDVALSEQAPLNTILDSS